MSRRPKNQPRLPKPQPGPSAFQPWSVEPPLEPLEPRLSLTGTSWQTPDLLADPLPGPSDDAATLAVPPPTSDSSIQATVAPQGNIAPSDAAPVDHVQDVTPAVEPTSLEALATTGPGGAVGVVQDGQGVIVAAFNNAGSLVSFDIEGEEFAWSVDQDRLGGGEGERVFAGFRDPGTGEARLAVVGRDGLRLLRREESGGLAEVAGGPSPNISRGVTAFVSKDGRAHVAGLTDDGALLLSYERLVTGENGPERPWTTADLGAFHLGVRGILTPRFAGEFASFTTPWGGMNIIGADVDGQVWSVWWTPGMRRWTASNLSAAADAPAIVGGVVGMASPGGALHVFGADAQGHLHALSWSAAGGRGAWTSEDLTRTTGAPSLQAGTLAGFRSSWNTLSVFGLDTAGDVRATWWTPRVGRWISESVSAELHAGAPRIAGPLSGYVARDGTQNLVGATADGRVVRLAWTLDGSDAWNADDLSDRALTGL